MPKAAAIQDFQVMACGKFDTELDLSDRICVLVTRA